MGKEKREGKQQKLMQRERELGEEEGHNFEFCSSPFFSQWMSPFSHKIFPETELNYAE